MITVQDAESIIQSQVRNYGTEYVSIHHALGRVLAEDLYADRDIPSFNRVAMDGIAIRFAAFQKGLRSFSISATQAAGQPPIDILADEECIEIMTGAALPSSADSVVRYEDLEILNGIATVKVDQLKQAQNVHSQGKDRRAGDVVATKDKIITAAMINIAASVGATKILVKKLPRVVILSTGDELVEVDQQPSPYQIRRSNVYGIRAVLEQLQVQPTLLHIADDEAQIRTELQECLSNYDVIILSGGVSMGKFDHVPAVLEALQVKKQFHKVQQRPGKPFWFGVHDNGVVVFAFPGNPVSTFMCMHRYCLPWLHACLGLKEAEQYAVLNEAITFNPSLTFFMQVELRMNKHGTLLATPIEGNGSGDFANLLLADAFMELPAEQNTFNSGEVFRVLKINKS
jgi:molybdopterin molybdotransferase